MDHGRNFGLGWFRDSGCEFRMTASPTVTWRNSQRIRFKWPPNGGVNVRVGNGWASWTNVGRALSDLAPAAVNGKLFFVGRAPNTDLWWWRQTRSQRTSIGNNGVDAGALASAPR